MKSNIVRLMTEVPLESLHASLDSPVSASMNFLNEVALHYPDAISFAAGRPYEGFFDVDTVHRHVETFRAYLGERHNGDEALVQRDLLQYGRTKGIISELVSEHLRVDEGISVDPEAVVVTVGCQEALYLTLRALRRDDRDVLLAVAPTYAGAHGAASLVDMKVLPVRDSEEGIDLADLAAVVGKAHEQRLRPRAVYVVPDFANPTGTSLSVDMRRRLLESATRHDLLVLEDNPYGILGSEARLPTLKSLDRASRVIYLGSFAKTGVPGARVGYAVADQTVRTGFGTDVLLADQLAKLKSMLTVNTSPIAQAVIGGKLLENAFSLRAANDRERKVYHRNLHHVLQGLEERYPPGTAPMVSWTTPTGGFFVLISVPFALDDASLRHSARKHRVLWTPVHHFYADRRPRQQMRLSFSHLLPKEIEDGLDRLSEFIHEQIEIGGVC
ncbi:aminotransferase-like domain-containing protein [Streptomyces koyangensis]|uniref:PLP-dependent aminotransferase family protein n=1 Tax=Streptomyces koyangensis TaxID=188770 RepID=A0A385D591_9ACTN|nr:PLP-dependent aminotransferase family protein [Streptomyces koyangensis]AXQ53542.1 PLP-dependent aminotransferase family protein [Streptomyces koyangensis]